MVVMAFCDVLQKSQKQFTNISLKQWLSVVHFDVCPNIKPILHYKILRLCLVRKLKTICVGWIQNRFLTKSA